ncbi:uncharacterized protein ARMOST_15899 [Armillaria ostoyae]|uniref:Uncharacterized protein n=1 Tax=Armillaria ostoyae TaxID=47428 RepID=A0A284RUR3_ARMOS|nr:uncharacterized protein ARMOST_15899 [Armillaria ostoyae]
MAVKHQLYWQNENSTSSGVGLGTGDVSALVDEKLDAIGMSEGTKGRSVILDEPVSVEELVGRVERHPGLSQVQVEYPSAIFRTVAICAEPGGSLLVGRDVDVYFAVSLLSSSTPFCGSYKNTEGGYRSLLAERRRKGIQVEDLLDVEAEVTVSISLFQAQCTTRTRNLQPEYGYALPQMPAERNIALSGTKRRLQF